MILSWRGRRWQDIYLIVHTNIYSGHVPFEGLYLVNLINSPITYYIDLYIFPTLTKYNFLLTQVERFKKKAKK